MTRERVTIDVWEFWCNYGEGWEYENVELSRPAMRANAKAYRENSPYPLKIRKRRVRKDQLDTHNPARP